MHTDDWETLSAQLASHMASVRRVFNELIGDDEAQSPDEQLAEYWRELWQDALEEDDASPALAHLNDADRRSVLALIADFRKELDRRTIGPRGRQVLDQLMPHLLSEICSRADAPLPLARITPLLTGIVTRTTYLELLSEFPGALKHLITLCAASPMVASQLARHPLLLDELLDPNTLYQPTATVPIATSCASICCACRKRMKSSSWRHCASSSRRSGCISPRRISPARCR